MISTKKEKTLIEVKREKKIDRKWTRKLLETLKACFELPVLGHLWIIAVYFSPGCDLILSEIFDTRLQNVYICAVFNAPHQELNFKLGLKTVKKYLKLLKTQLLGF